jgi:hypothetical protein
MRDCINNTIIQEIHFIINFQDDKQQFVEKVSRKTFLSVKMMFQFKQKKGNRRG